MQKTERAHGGDVVDERELAADRDAGNGRGVPERERPTAQTTPTASAVPTDAKASRAQSADRDLRMVGSMTARSG